MANYSRIESALIHGGVFGDALTHSVNVPIYQTSTYQQIELEGNPKWEYPAILDLYTTLLRKELERPPQERAAEKPVAREESKPRQEIKQEPSKPAKRRSEPSL